MKKTVISHLEELRSRLITVLLCVALFSLAGMIFSGWFIQVLIDNLTRNIPVTFISVTPFEFIATQIKLGIFIGAVIALPVAVYQLVRFVRPALRKEEKKYLYIALPAGLALFVLGFAFAYFIFLKVALVMLGSLGLKYGVENYWSISSFVTTVFMSCVVIGLLFNMPVLVGVLSRIGILRKELLAAKRVYMYVFVFVFAAIITPPDVITQVLIAIPMIVLYEISLLLVRK
ncbi:twin-arginine translocase subunit TatC [Candidatus Woesearchaeota archaeon]|nr:twin-arginine translocase subunit TatC [Candidatus Woesearchaeota archaeon]